MAHNFLRLSIVLAFISIFAGCASTMRFDEKTYSYGEAKKCSEGDLIASELYGEVKSSGRVWVGLLNAEDGWGPKKQKFSDDYIEKKLFYLGFESPYLYLLYREYSRGNRKPSFDQTIKYDLNRTTFVTIGDYNIEVAYIDNTQASFLILDELTFVEKKKQFKIAQNKPEEELLSKVINSINLIINEAQEAKNYVDQFDETSTFSSYIQTVNAFDKLKNYKQEYNASHHSAVQLMEIYKKLETQVKQYAQFFTIVATALESWDEMLVELQKAVQSGIGKEYFARALDIKNSGEQDLKAELFEKATQKFSQAKNEFNHVLNTKS